MGQHFAPEGIAGAQLATQMVESLVQRGHSVTFATCFPNHPTGIVPNDYKGKLFSREKTSEGAVVLRAWSYTSPKKTSKRRLINYGTFSITVLFAALRAKKPDIVVSFSPPLPLGITAWIVSRWFKVPWIVRVEDLFPETAIKAGVFRNKTIIRFLEWMELFIYRKATHISVISEPMSQIIVAKNISESKISVTPVWADPSEISPLPKETKFRKEHGLQDKFVILYTGNLGYTSAFADVLEAATLLRERSDICFVVVGEGPRKEEFLRVKKDNRLDNVVFLPYQPRANYSDVLASADFSLVSLNQDSANTSLPSKIFNYMASARPILAIAPEESALAEIVQSRRVGIVITPGNAQELATVIINYQNKQDALMKMGFAGRKLLEDHFSRESCINSYENLFKLTVKNTEKSCLSS